MKKTLPRKAGARKGLFPCLLWGFSEGNTGRSRDVGERDEPMEGQKREGSKGQECDCGFESHRDGGGVGSLRLERMVINLRKFNRTKRLISMMATERFVLIIAYHP